MTIRLIKRDEQVRQEPKTNEQPSVSQLMTTTRSWVDEYKARKASGDSLLNNFRKLS